MKKKPEKTHLPPVRVEYADIDMLREEIKRRRLEHSSDATISDLVREAIREQYGKK